MSLAGIHLSPKDDVIRHRRSKLSPNLLTIHLRLVRVANEVVNGPVCMHRCVPLFENLDEPLRFQAA